MTIKLSKYWKCQLAGWTLTYCFSTVVSLLNNVPLKNMIPVYLIFIVIGMLITHLMKNIMEWLRILQKKFFYQMLWVLISTVIFAILYLFITNFIVNFLNSKNFIHDVINANRLYLRNLLFNFGANALIFLTWNLFYFAYYYLQRAKKEEHLKFNRERELLELEAKALRSQMNPHFIFNCLNSIKSLIQQHEEEKSVNYLTTFSKLIRTLFNNAEKKEISLYDEIETCKLYLQLEAMRFDTRFSYDVHVDENLDLKSFEVPALIIQPFIENAIWHGIVPKGEGGHIDLSVIRKVNSVEIIIDDNGIGREASKQNKSASTLMHNSKGVNLTQSRLELDNLLRQRQAQLEITDKKDEQGLATGTKVIIAINEELS